ncbi:MAG: TonB-dependent receptor plug domain-containing protein, partial [Woeseiaceae bacterium]
MNTKHLLAGCATGVFLICLVQPVEAAADGESADSDITPVEVEEIVVTGSRIKRRDFVSASPLTTISRDDLVFSGQPTLEESLNQMPQVSPSFGRASNNPGTGTAAIDLRGLGPDRTLTLLNGRRIGGTGVGNAEDLNNIPQFLVERVEIITGGTSAVYGSDAIAGVVNFITRDDFTGLGVEASTSMSEPGDAETYDFNLAYGQEFANGRGHFTVFANYYDRKPLFAADRASTATPYRDNWGGELIEAGSPIVPKGVVYWPYADLGNGPVEVTFNPDGT